MAHGDIGAAVQSALAAVELVRLDGDGPRVGALRDAVLRHRIDPGQQRFVDLATHTLPRADADPNRTPFAVVHEGRAVGFGIIDRAGCLREIAEDPARSVLLRAFYIASQWQGRGLGRAACAALPPLVAGITRDADTVLLTVNQDNSIARRAYLASGFTDTGRVYLGAGVGPQDVLIRANQPETPPSAATAAGRREPPG